MTIRAKKTPKLTSVANARVSPGGDSVEILFQDAAEGYTSVEISAGILGALVSDLLGLATQIPSISDVPAQSLPTQDFDLVMGEDGSLAWRVTVEGGVHFELTFRPDQFSELDRLMAEARGLSGGRQ